MVLWAYSSANGAKGQEIESPWNQEKWAKVSTQKHGTFSFRLSEHRLTCWITQPHALLSLAKLARLSRSWRLAKNIYKPFSAIPCNDIIAYFSNFTIFNFVPNTIFFTFMCSPSNRLQTCLVIYLNSVHFDWIYIFQNKISKNFLVFSFIFLVTSLFSFLVKLFAFYLQRNITG